jgi:protein-S-isoprenylcysteine O-methyltransferase Ste14
MTTTPNWWGISEQQMHHEMKDKRFYSLINKFFYLLLLVECVKNQVATRALVIFLRIHLATT